MEKKRCADGYSGACRLNASESRVIVHHVVGEKDFLAAAAAHVQSREIVQCSSRANTREQPTILLVPEAMLLRRTLSRLGKRLRITRSLLLGRFLGLGRVCAEENDKTQKAQQTGSVQTLPPWLELCVSCGCVLSQLLNFFSRKTAARISVGEFATRSCAGLSFSLGSVIVKISPEINMGRAFMSRSILFRTRLGVMLSLALLPAARAQSQDSDSVAEAARRAREQKKAKANKPAKVITDDTFEVKKEDVQSATAEVPKLPGTNAPTSGANAAPAPSGNAANASGAAKDERLKKELADLQERLKTALTDLDLLRRENRLDSDTFYSKPD